MEKPTVLIKVSNGKATAYHSEDIEVIIRDTDREGGGEQCRARLYHMKKGVVQEEVETEHLKLREINIQEAINQWKDADVLPHQILIIEPMQENGHKSHLFNYRLTHGASVIQWWAELDDMSKGFDQQETNEVECQQVMLVNDGDFKTLLDESSEMLKNYEELLSETDTQGDSMGWLNIRALRKSIETIKQRFNHG